MLKFFEIYKNQIVSLAVLFLFALNIIIWSSVILISKLPELTVYFFDVGQGDSQFISAKDGTQILIDGGPNSRVVSGLGKAMPYFDNTIDVIILTHPHADHVSGLIDVLKRYKVGLVIESGVEYDTAEYNEFKRIVKEKKIKKVVIENPVKLMFYDGAILEFLYPERSHFAETLKNVHDAMLVSRLSFNKRNILFMGDAEKNVEAKLIYTDAVGKVDILKVGHHGSKSSTNDFFLGVIKPDYAVISSGKGNRYGHPTQQALTNLESVGAKIFRTDLDGSLRAEINNGALHLVNY